MFSKYLELLMPGGPGPVSLRLITEIDSAFRPIRLRIGCGQRARLAILSRLGRRADGTCRVPFQLFNLLVGRSALAHSRRRDIHVAVPGKRSFISGYLVLRTLPESGRNQHRQCQRQANSHNYLPNLGKPNFNRLVTHCRAGNWTTVELCATL